MIKWLAALCTLCLATVPAFADAPCTTITFENAAYSVCTARPGRDDIRLFLNGRDGTPYGTFSGVKKELQPGQTLAFAMNAGMYHANRAPVGLYVESGHEVVAINLRNGPGNFHMRPNGVFYIKGKSADVMEAARFSKSGKKSLYATQSGPMLVIDGKLHPKILANGNSAKIRNGVGVSSNGVVYFVISEAPVTFHTFARLFRDTLNCRNALFLDGSISSLYAPSLGKTSDPFITHGPMVGVVVDTKAQK